MSTHRKHIVIDARIRRASTGRPIDRLVEQLQDLDHFHRYTILVEPDDEWQMRSQNFKTVPCPYPQFSFSPFQQLGFAWLLYKLRPDLVHFTMTQQPLLYFGNIVTFTHDTTMYSFVRRGSTPPLLYKLKMASYRFLVWFSHRKSKYILFPTNTVAQEFAKLQPFTAQKSVVTYEAGDLPSEEKATQPASVSGDFLLYVGTAFPHKNLKTTIRGFNILHQRHPHLKLVLTGKREKHYEELEAWAVSQPSYKNIIFTGFVSNGELKWLFEHCRAYVFASLSEGFGLPPLEAMAHGAPVVSSNASCIPEVNGDAAHYFDGKDPEALAAAVDDVLQNPKLRADLIAKGHKQLKKYSWRKMAEETMTVYKAALDEELPD